MIFEDKDYAEYLAKKILKYERLYRLYKVEYDFYLKDGYLCLDCSFPNGMKSNSRDALEPYVRHTSVKLHLMERTYQECKSYEAHEYLKNHVPIKYRKMIKKYLHV